MAIFSKDPTPQKSASSSAPTGPQGARVSFIGPNIVVDGTLTGNENVVIEGAVRGKINLQSDLRIGSSARVEATVHAKNVVVEGTLVGDLSADSRVELIASAKVDGNIKAPRIVVAEGAHFKGSVDMGSEPRGDGKTGEEQKEKLNASNRDTKVK